MNLRARLYGTSDPVAGSRLLTERLPAPPSERRICVAEIELGSWLALTVDEGPDGVTAAAGPDPVSAFAALVGKLPWLATGEAA